MAVWLGPAIVLLARSRNAVVVIGIAAIASLVLQRTHLLYGNTATAISSLGALVLIAAAVQADRPCRRRRRPSHEYNEGRGSAPSLALAVLLGAAVLSGSIWCTPTPWRRRSCTAGASRLWATGSPRGRSTTSAPEGVRSRSCWRRLPPLR